MRVAIAVCSGPSTGRRLTMRAGQIARFGRSDWADFAFHDDQAMADVQFEIYCDDHSCTLVSLTGNPPTLVNGQSATNVRLQSGDRIMAGQTELALDIQGSAGDPTAAAMEVAAATAISQSNKAETAELSEYFGLSDLAKELAASHENAVTFEHRLIEAGLLGDAVRWRAHRLPKPLAVRWALECIHSEDALRFSPVQATAIETAGKWAQDPSEEHRQLAMQQLARTESSGLGGAVSAAAAWSSGSLAPVGVDPVPPDERLTGHCVATAINMVSHMSSSSESVAERLRRYLAIPTGG